jgi:putative phosphoesterase
LKIGVISDTHLSSRNQRLSDIFNKYLSDCDLILHAGDLIHAEIFDAFGKKDIRAVHGNMDLPSVKQKLPDKLIVEINGFRIGLIHGWGAPRDIEDRLLQTIGPVDCLVYGHTHRAANKVKDGILFFNPGSPTDKRFADSRTIGILTLDQTIKGEIIELDDD